MDYYYPVLFTHTVSFVSTQSNPLPMWVHVGASINLTCAFCSSCCPSLHLQPPLSLLIFACKVRRLLFCFNDLYLHVFHSAPSANLHIVTLARYVLIEFSPSVLILISFPIVYRPFSTLSTFSLRV
jgi:hypothetical protein